MRTNILPKRFYARDPAEVAQDLLGKLIVRKIKGKKIIGKIVETEAYYGLKDPCSRANTTPKMAKPMWEDPGKTFVYMVHNNWLLNLVTTKKGIPAAVLIRAIEPLAESNLIERHRRKKGKDLTNGPGKLTAALKIEKRHNLMNIFEPWSDLNIIKLPVKQRFKVKKTNRVGVKYDLKRKLRFYIKNNSWVSKGQIYGELH